MGYSLKLTNAIFDRVNLTGLDLGAAIVPMPRISIDAAMENFDSIGTSRLNLLETRELCQIASGENSQTGVHNHDSLGCK